MNENLMDVIIEENEIFIFDFNETKDTIFFKIIVLILIDALLNIV